MTAGASEHANAERLSEALVRAAVAVVPADPEEAGRRRAAIADLTRYVELLRESGERVARASYLFKRDYPDGRWDVAELELTHEPAPGQLVRFREGQWRILGLRVVTPRPETKAPRRYFTCAFVG